MYILKNAVRDLTRSKGRTILSFILILAIAVSACVALSIQSSAAKAKVQMEESMSVTASIGVDRMSMMQGGGMEDMSAMMELMGTTLSLEEMQVYAEAESVSGFYYMDSASLNGVDMTAYETSSNNMMSTMGAGGMGRGMMGGSSGDYSVIGVSEHSAMTEFLDGTLTVSEGSMFLEDDSENTVAISAELAYLNELAVGDTFTLVNPNNEADTAEFKIGAIFECAATDSYSNTMYISHTSMSNIIANSQAVAVDYETENPMTGTQTVSSAYTQNTSGTYVFDTVEAYESFEAEAEGLGLDTETFSITSLDLAQFEQSLVPLENLSQFTMIFFVVVLAIGAVVLVVFQLFSIRERKYEIGVLAAIGMQKPKVAMQFLCEILIISLVAVVVGIGIGAVAAQPIGDTLLASQVESLETQSSNQMANFGGSFGGRGDMGGGMVMAGLGATGTGDVEVVDTMTTALDLNVVMQVLGVGILLSLIISSVGLISVLRYEPLKILSNRA